MPPRPLELIEGLLVDPDSGSPLELAGEESGQLRLVADGGRSFPVVDGIPRFVAESATAQAQTGMSFGYKWGRTDTYLSPAMQRMGRTWLLERYGFPTIESMRGYLEGHDAVLDLGCGGGYTSSLWMDGQWSGRLWLGLDLSTAIDVARNRLGHLSGTAFVQGDILRLPFRSGAFDVVIAEGVLHHTPSTRQALESAARVLAPGGELMFYVYRRKGPIREFADDYVRDRLSRLPPDEAWEALRPLTRLGQALAETGASVTIAEDVPLLEVPAGTYDVQRLFYWHVAKAFWNPEMSFEENHHINFDWYHPAYAHRQSEDEVRAWCVAVGLRITHFNAQESGFTVRAVLDKASNGSR
ncbi:MAG: class I SAM-dependent methyltransferase [Chloroflexota bacterium]|nr:MAG: class I SAM-dependent methyltransferase [Chloroflexota bacterium]